jgi:hypothetical protein
MEDRRPESAGSCQAPRDEPSRYVPMCMEWSDDWPPPRRGLVVAGSHVQNQTILRSRPLSRSARNLPLSDSASFG